MLGCSSSRISHQNLGLGICSTRILQLSSSFTIKLPSSSSAAAAVAFFHNNFHNHRFHPRFVSSSSLHSKSAGDIPFLPDSFRSVEGSSGSFRRKVCKVSSQLVELPTIDIRSVEGSSEASLFDHPFGYVNPLAALVDLDRLQETTLTCDNTDCWVFDRLPDWRYSTDFSRKNRKIPQQGGIVALGKFDALHIGHRELAIQASKVGIPYLLSFVGMAEVLGWEPRPPIVARCDRERVLSSWAPYCGNVAPKEFQVQFMSVRHLNPREFVEKLAKELGVCGVVAGENYRFGYKAAGDASELVRLCDEFGIGAYIINSVMDRHQDARNMNRYDLKERGQVSSTRVRRALAEGDMKYVSELLGRPHRLLLTIKDWENFTGTSSKQRVSAPKSSLLNLPPKDGSYENCALLFGEREPVTCRVSIDTTHIHLEVDRVDFIDDDYSQNSQGLGIEFGELRVNCV